MKQKTIDRGNKMTKTASFRCSCLLLAATASVQAGPAGFTTLEGLARQATDIVIGRTAGVQASGSTVFLTIEVQ